jgi:hypothetical protein
MSECNQNSVWKPYFYFRKPHCVTVSKTIKVEVVYILRFALRLLFSLVVFLALPELTDLFYPINYSDLFNINYRVSRGVKNNVKYYAFCRWSWVQGLRHVRRVYWFAFQQEQKSHEVIPFQLLLARNRDRCLFSTVCLGFIETSGSMGPSVKLLPLRQCTWDCRAWDNRHPWRENPKAPSLPPEQFCKIDNL